MKVIYLHDGTEVFVDDEDYDYLVDAVESWSRNNEYAIAAVRNGTQTTQFYMHKMIMRAGKGQIIDHRDGNTFNNQKYNLRPASNTENIRNSKLRKDTNTGLKGVHYCNRDKRYIARIAIDRKRIGLGYFTDPRVAAVEYNRAALKYHGEFANLNKPIGGHFNVR